MTRAALTYRYERWRAVSAGVLEAATTTFLLLIAVRWFEAGAFAKGCVAAGSGLGYLLAPFVVSGVEAARTPVARASAYLALVGAASLAIAAAWPSLTLFVIASLVSIAAVNAVIPLLTQIYQDNYSEDVRGRLFARAFMIRIASVIVFSAVAGRLLSDDIRSFRLLLVAFAVALVSSAWCLWRIPSAPLHVSGGRHPFHSLRHAREDRVFRTTLISWMFMGFANLMMVPLRVEYLANPRYHLELGTATIALLTGVVPNLARMLMSPIWGVVFDRANFFVLRIALNAGFAVGIASFFMSNSMPGLIVAAITYGISVAGGDVAWNLWVMKIAPADRVADYMSVHTFFTGIRGIAAPIVGFALAAHWSMPALGWFSAALIATGTLFLLPEVRDNPLAKRAEARVARPPEDVAEP